MTLSASYQRNSWPVSLLSGGHGNLARLECAECGAKDEWRINGSRPPAEALPKHFKNKGWQVVKRPTCPDCMNKKRKLNMTANVTPIKTEAAKGTDVVALRRQANEHLHTYFNHVTGQYDEGWSDERIAKEFGLAPQWVTKHREENHGSLKEPSELAEVRGNIDNLTSELGKLRAKLDAIARKGGWAV